MVVYNSRVDDSDDDLLGLGLRRLRPDRRHIYALKPPLFAVKRVVRLGDFNLLIFGGDDARRRRKAHYIIRHRRHDARVAAQPFDKFLRALPARAAQLRDRVSFASAALIAVRRKRPRRAPTVYRIFGVRSRLHRKEIMHHHGAELRCRVRRSVRHTLRRSARRPRGNPLPQHDYGLALHITRRGRKRRLRRTDSRQYQNKQTFYNAVHRTTPFERFP